MSSEDTEILRAVQRLSKDREAQAAERAPLSPNSTRDIMARIRRQEAREESHESALGWLVFIRSRTALAISAALVVLALVVLVPLGSSTAQFAMALPQGIKGEPPRPPDFYLDPAPKLSVDWKHLTFRIPLRAGGELSGTIAPVAGSPGVASRVFEIKASGVSKGESIAATGQLVVMPNKPDDAPSVLHAKDVYWLKLSLTLRGGAREERVYRVFGTP